MSSKAGTYHSSDNWKPHLFLRHFVKFWPLFTVKHGDFRHWNDPHYGQNKGISDRKDPFSQKNRFSLQMILKHRTLTLVNTPYCVESDPVMWNHRYFWVKTPCLFCFTGLEKLPPFPWNSEQWYLLSNRGRTFLIMSDTPVLGTNCSLAVDQLDWICHFRFPVIC